MKHFKIPRRTGDCRLHDDPLRAWLDAQEDGALAGDAMTVAQRVWDAATIAEREECAKVWKNGICGKTGSDPNFCNTEIEAQRLAAALLTAFRDGEFFAQSSIASLGVEIAELRQQLDAANTLINKYREETTSMRQQLEKANAENITNYHHVATHYR